MVKNKKHLFVIDHWEDLYKNFETLDCYKNSSCDDERDFWEQLIKNGICFLILRRADKYLFAPSRFIGYYNNDIHSHRTSHIYGPETNEAISFLLGYTPLFNYKADDLYYKFCFENKITPNANGSFGKIRKYWYNSDNEDDIYMIFENHKMNTQRPANIKIIFDERYEYWRFVNIIVGEKIVQGEAYIPLKSPDKIQVKGQWVNELICEFQWIEEDHSYSCLVDKFDLMNSKQRLMVKRNVRLKLKEIITKSNLSNPLI